MEEGVNYKAHPDYPKYLIGDDGSVWSSCVLGSNKGRTSDKWHKLSVGYAKDGRGHVNLNNGFRPKSVSVCRLVIETFKGPCPAGMECCHNDGNPRNNKIDNLRWDTRLENVHDMIRHGTNPKGESHSHAKLTESQVLEIRKMIKSGMTLISIAKIFNISWQSVSGIKYWRRWKHLKEKEDLNDSH